MQNSWAYSTCFAMIVSAVMGCVSNDTDANDAAGAVQAGRAGTGGLASRTESSPVAGASVPGGMRAASSSVPMAGVMAERCTVNGVELSVGASTQVECNTCFCEAGGELICTQADCENPVACTVDECGPAPGVPNRDCPDGINVEGFGPCQRLENGECGFPRLTCPESACETIECGADQVCVNGDCIAESERCTPGESFPAGDGCNTCECPASAQRADALCSSAPCAPRCDSTAQCEPEAYCDFGDQLCGMGTRSGTCRMRPVECPEPGGVPTCGCGGTFGFSGCELGLIGEDVTSAGGCSKPDAPDRFICHSTDCALETQACSITLDDGMVGIADGACVDVPDGCRPGRCPCAHSSVEMAACYVIGGATFFVFTGE
ncbi:MAG: hypothetical protein VX589_15835 [Myxococcota bacterium]|nr:hypothetical protein [Myxococcota bacterium]